MYIALRHHDSFMSLEYEPPFRALYIFQCVAYYIKASKFILMCLLDVHMNMNLICLHCMISLAAELYGYFKGMLLWLQHKVPLFSLKLANLNLWSLISLR